MKSLEIYDKTTSLCPVWKKNILQYYINSETYMAYYPKWLKYLLSI